MADALSNHNRHMAQFYGQVDDARRQAEQMGINVSGVPLGDIAKRVQYAQDFRDVGRKGYRQDLLSQIGVKNKDLPPEYRQQLKQLLDMGAQGKEQTHAFNDILEGMKATAPIVAAQERRFAPYEQAGLSALDQQMALLGLSGQKAMNKAYMENPAQQFAREQAEKAMIRNRAATGGLGDEGVQRELASLTSGLTNQNIQQQLQQLGLLSGRGQGASFAGAEATAGGLADAYSLGQNRQQQRAMDRAGSTGLGGFMNDLGMVSNAISLGSSIIPGIGAAANFLGGLGGGAAGASGVTDLVPSVGTGIYQQYVNE